MSGTSQPLSPEFFTNPRWPPDAVPVGVAVSLKAGISKEVQHSLAVGAKVDDNPDSLSRVAGEREDPDAFG